MGAAGAGVGAVSAATASAKTSSFLASLSVTKWVGIVAVGAAVTAGTHALTRPRVASRDAGARGSVSLAAGSRPRDVSPVGPGPTSRALPTVPEVIGVPDTNGGSTPRAAGDVAPSAIASVRSVAVAPSSLAPASEARPAAEGEDFPREVASLDLARGALEASAFDTAIETLNRHDLDFPHGRLRPEALAIRIQAYAAKRDAIRVRELATKFRAEYPEHPFAAHIQAMIDAAESGIKLARPGD